MGGCLGLPKGPTAHGVCPTPTPPWTKFLLDLPPACAPLCGEPCVLRRSLLLRVAVDLELVVNFAPAPVCGCVHFYDNVFSAA